MIDARLANITPIVHDIGNPVNPDTADNDDIDMMVQNLDMFT